MKTAAFIVSFFIIAVAPFLGQIGISLNNIFDSSTVDHQIFWDIRVPRVLLAFFTGGILSLGGLIFQTVFRNPMSTPFTLGVASGATLFTAIGIVLGFAAYMSVFAFLGSLLTIVILFSITNSLKSIQTTTLLLIGIALSFFYSACLMVLFFISDLSQSYEIVRFTMGSLDVVGFQSVYWMMFGSIILFGVVYRYKASIKLLLVSYEFAQLKGIDVKKTNYILLLSVSVAVGICVSITGPIGFIGLIVPHILKTIYKKSSEKLIGEVFIYGGVFLVACDILARNLTATSDIPIGVVTSFLGAPFFIYLIMRRKDK
ncbi:MAG: iron ABC transporter permease [Campylobacterota bacterium]|nr:iron ABC transporter permease [Campylobacterota bacterium]